MAFSYGFYNSINHDRKYSSEQISRIFDGVIQDGIFLGIGDQFAIQVGSGLQTIVKSGRAWFNHTWSYNDSPLYLTHDMADPFLKRCDAIVLEINATPTVRMNSIKIITGTPSSGGTKPELTNTALIHQYPLAYVTLNSGATSISESNIEYCVGREPTPYVTSILEKTDITPVWNQWKSQFNDIINQKSTAFDTMQSQKSTAFDTMQSQKSTAFDTMQSQKQTAFDTMMRENDDEFQTWFDNLKLQLTEDVVTNLQNQIDDLNSSKVNKADVSTTALAQVGSDNTHWMTPLRTHEHFMAQKATSETDYNTNHWTTNDYVRTEIRDQFLKGMVVGMGSAYDVFEQAFQDVSYNNAVEYIYINPLGEGIQDCGTSSSKNARAMIIYTLLDDSAVIFLNSGINTRNFVAIYMGGIYDTNGKPFVKKTTFASLGNGGKVNYIVPVLLSGYLPYNGDTTLTQSMMPDSFFFYITIPDYFDKLFRLELSTGTFTSIRSSFSHYVRSYFIGVSVSHSIAVYDVSRDSVISNPYIQHNINGSTHDIVLTFTQTNSTEFAVAKTLTYTTSRPSTAMAQFPTAKSPAFFMSNAQNNDSTHKYIYDSFSSNELLVAVGGFASSFPLALMIRLNTSTTALSIVACWGWRRTLSSSQYGLNVNRVGHIYYGLCGIIFIIGSVIIFCYQMTPNTATGVVYEGSHIDEFLNKTTSYGEDLTDTWKPRPFSTKFNAQASVVLFLDNDHEKSVRIILGRAPIIHKIHIDRSLKIDTYDSLNTLWFSHRTANHSISKSRVYSMGGYHDIIYRSYTFDGGLYRECYMDPNSNTDINPDYPTTSTIMPFLPKKATSYVDFSPGGEIQITNAGLGIAPIVIGIGCCYIIVIDDKSVRIILYRGDNTVVSHPES